jgi:hypothetical protein
MRPIQLPLEQFRSVWPVILLILAISAAFIGSVLILNHWTGFGLGRLTRDLASIGGLPPFAGFLSQTGLLLWAASAAICLVGARALAGRGNRSTRSFLTSAGLLTVVLCIDDAFQLHENVLPFFGIPEVFVLGGYVFLMVGFLFKYHQRILRTEYILFGIALTFFSISMTLDLWHPPGWNRWFHEDSTRFAGIVAWLAYFFRTTVGALKADYRD